MVNHGSPRRSDLTAAARIRNVALEGFANNGVAATSIRAVAVAANVSAGLVQYHYPSKAALRDAVEEHVLDMATTAFDGLRPDAGAGGVAEEFGKRITSQFRDQPAVLRYVARGLIEGDERAMKLFDAFVAIAAALVRRDIADGRMSGEIDREWASLHVLVYNLGVVLLEHVIDRQLSEPLHSADGLERWRKAATAMFEHGLYERG